MQMDQIGQGIADRRKQLGLSQEELGRRIGVTRQAVSRWESGTALPSVDNMVELSRALEISVDELLQLAPQEIDSSLTPQSLGLLLDEQTARQEKRIRWLTVALAAAALVLVAGIAVSTVAGLLRSSRMEAQLNERISGINQSLSANISNLNARISSTIQQAVSDGNTRLTDSSYRESYDHDSRAFALDVLAQVKELGEHANAEFYFISNDGTRFFSLAEWTDSGFTGRILIPDKGQEWISGKLYISWQEDGETITEKIPYYNVTPYFLRLEINWISLNSYYTKNVGVKVKPLTTIRFSNDFPNTYPVSICYDFFHDGKLLQTITEPITVQYSNSEPVYYDHTLADYIPLEGVTSTEGLKLRVTVTDALGREFTKEHIPEH